MARLNQSYDPAYLEGKCYRYAELLKKGNSVLTIECAIHPYAGLIHAYCRNSDHEYLDCRGTFTAEEKENFFSPFTFVGEGSKHVEFVQFDNLDEFRNYIFTLFKNGIEKYDEEEDRFYSIPFVW